MDSLPMSDVDLTVPLFDDLVLQNPIWVASSHLTSDEGVLESWATYAPGAVTLKTTSRAFGGSGKGNRTYLKLGRGESWYVDGPKHVELLSGPRTGKLLAAALELLPATKIGVSVLSGEDYPAFAEDARGAHFVELNLKYSARMDAAEAGGSFCDFHQGRHAELLADVEAFSDSFPDTPQFIKLTREIPWLSPCAEWDSFVGLVRMLHSKGRRIGLVLANTRKVRIPPSMTGVGRAENAELSGGVVCGEALFLETYNLIRGLRLGGPSLEGVPIIGTGGVVGLREFVDVLYAGAETAQICTAFQENQMQYSAWLLGQLVRLLEAARMPSVREFARRLRIEGETELRRMRERAAELDVAFPEFAESEILGRRREILGILTQTLQSEATLAAEAEFQLPDDVPVMVAERLNLPGLRLDVDAEQMVLSEEFGGGREELNLQVHSMVASLLGHAVFLALRDRLPGEVTIERHDTSSGVLKRIRESKEWHLAVISEAHLDVVGELEFPEENQPILLGVIGLGRYELLKTAPGAPLREIYHFGGRQSEACLGAVRRAVPEMAGADVKRATVAQLAQILQHEVPGIAVFAKNPIAQVYSSVLSSGGGLQAVTSTGVRYLLLGSQQLVENLGAVGLANLYSELRKIAGEIKDDPAEFILLLERDNYIDTLARYLSAGRGSPLR